ncbi:MAG: probable membrane protein YPO3302 [Olavius algarvensis Delta 4 endosymbiont]|nr:MAG: probable membrane protein YPO3302 [Olavius algarvensis Delta 4 endosymbiont]
MTAYMIANFGYLGLFLISFLAATLLPLGSEATVAFMAAGEFNPLGLLFIATAGNSLGALVNYLVGRWGANIVFSRFIKIDQATQEKMEKVYGRWGAPVLFFAWLPFVGDPLTVAAGVLRVNLYLFAFWVVLGKACRYYVVIAATAG